VNEIGRVDDERIAFPFADGFAIEAAHRNFGIRVAASIEIDDPQAIHQLLDHEDGRWNLDHRDRPHARHHDRYASRPAEPDIIAIDLAFFGGLLRGIIVLLRFGRELEPRWRIESFGFP